MQNILLLKRYDRDVYYKMFVLKLQKFVSTHMHESSPQSYLRKQFCESPQFI